jgi:hypothetical protein
MSAAQPRSQVPHGGAGLSRPGIGQQPLHPRLAELLRRIQEAERTAVGDRRRPTFRLMREVLSAAMRVGVPVALLAECLGTRSDSVRDRAQGTDGVMDAELIKRLTDLDPEQLDADSLGELTRHRPDDTDLVTFPTIDVVRALLKTPRRDPETGR